MKRDWDIFMMQLSTGVEHTVSWVYRKDWERDAMNRLARRGLFTVKQSKGFDVYTRTDKPYAKELNPKRTYPKGDEVVN